MGFYRPHDPSQSPRKYFGHYDPSKFDLPKSPDGYKPPYPLTLGGGAFKDAFDTFTDKERREFLHAYSAGVSFIDAQVGRLLDALDKNQLAENTIVVFLGDHGYELGVRNWWNENTLFERGCRTPLIVRVPAAKGNGRATAALAEFIDIYPTLADLCGLKDVPKQLEGTSFRKVLDDLTAKHKHVALTVPEFPLPPLVDAAAGEDGPNLVVGAKRLRLLLFRVIQLGGRELGRDRSPSVCPIPHGSERRDGFADGLRLDRVGAFPWQARKGVLYPEHRRIVYTMLGFSRQGA